MHLPRQLCTFVICALAVGLLCADAGAAPIQPFEAVVQAAPGEDVYARSGPGKERFYPTLKLADGQRVMVRRKDPGGWFMIDPPEGSFSWFPGRYIERNGAQGTVANTHEPVVVRVGAFNGNQRNVEQVRLNRGDRVEILSEETIETEREGKLVKESWYRIKPPPGEFRWVKGSSLVELNPDGSPKVVTSKRPVTGGAEKKQDEPPAVAKSNPKKGDSHTPALPVNPDEGDAPLYGQAPGQRLTPGESDSDLGPEGYLGSMPRPDSQAAIRRKLLAIGQKMQEIRGLPETQWDLSVVESELLALLQAADGTSLMPLVEHRMRELRRDQVIHRNAVELAMRAERRPSYTQTLPNRPLDNGDPLDPRSGVYGAPAPLAPNPGAGGSVGLLPPHTVPPNSEARPGGSRFQGAGIVARVRNPVPDAPRYVLITPKGQLLCYLETQQNLNFEPYVGQAMGLNGQRGFDARLKADRMQVQQLTPIRLAP